jgi:hypothetical protein
MIITVAADPARRMRERITNGSMAPSNEEIRRHPGQNVTQNADLLVSDV